MPEPMWATLIAVHCDNKALQPHWDEVVDQLRMIVACCGWDTRRVSEKLREIAGVLDVVLSDSIDYTKPPSKRFK